jgi:hypothetical protein
MLPAASDLDIDEKRAPFGVFLSPGANLRDVSSTTGEWRRRESNPRNVSRNLNFADRRAFDSPGSGS